MKINYVKSERKPAQVESPPSYVHSREGRMYKIDTGGYAATYICMFVQIGYSKFSFVNIESGNRVTQELSLDEAYQFLKTRTLENGPCSFTILGAYELKDITLEHIPNES